MRKHPFALVATLAALALTANLRADVVPNPLFSDNALLQRDEKIPVWGTAEEGEKVRVEFAGQKVETVARNGHWKVWLDPMKASAEGRAMTITGNNTVTIHNLLVGEVWLCSGQSNMEANMAWFRKVSPNGAAVLASSTDPLLRIVRVPRREVDEPQAVAVIQWNPCDTNSVADFSAVAYFFGRDLRKQLGVPIGLIGSYEGGTPAEAWTDRAALSSDPDLKALLAAQAKREAEFDPAKLEEANNKIRAEYEAVAAKALAEGRPKPPGPFLGVGPKQDKQRPVCLYNGMIAPLQPYAIRGVIWYQGESNSHVPLLYRKLFPAMIASWRQQWGQGDFPFLFVQLAPCKRWSPGLREAQLLSWKSTPNTAMVVTTDVGDANDSHPKKKEPVGARLALAARALAYGEKIEYSGPEFDSMSVRENRAVIHFKHTGSGLVAKDGELKGFFVAGADGNFWPAKAEIKGDTVEVFREQVPAPAAVRYGWANVPDVNLYNKEGLPASPFRTDLSASFAFPCGIRDKALLEKKAPAFSIENNRVSFQTDAAWLQVGPPAIELLSERQAVKLSPSEPIAITTEHSETPLGPAEAKTWKWQDPKGYQYTRTITRLTQRQGFTVKMTFSNPTQSAVRLHTFILGNKTPDGLIAEGAPQNWIVSSLSPKARASDLGTDGRLGCRDILTVFTQRGARGLVMGPAGPGESEIVYNVEIKRGRAALQIVSEMNDVVVDPGETRRSEELLVLAEPYESALTHLFKWMAVTHEARTARGPVFGWCSWYSLWKTITEKRTEDALSSLVANRDRLPMQVFQIDDGWQKAYGDWEADPKKFPKGMKPIADKIRAAGMIPGLWLTMVTTSSNGAHPDGNPDKNLDPTHPETRAFIKSALRKRYADGFRYFKLDFNHPRLNDRYNQKLTRLQVRRDMFKLYREAIGEDSYLCACVGSLDRGAIGFADSVRIGTDSGPRWLPRYSGCCMADLFNEVGATALSNGILFAADPDVVFTVPEKYNAAPPLPNSVRVWHGWVGLLGGVMMTSDYFHAPPWNTDSAIRMMEILNPPAPEKGRAFDGQTDLWHPQFGFVATRPWGNFISVQLLNPKEESARVSLKGLPLAKVGSKFHVWSFWDRKYLGVADENLVLDQVSPGGGPLLRLTELPKDSSQPVFIGSDLHIGMGSAEIKKLVIGDNSLRVELTDAGARSGALFFHSVKLLSVRHYSGMEVKSVAAESPEIWKVSIANRQRGKPQAIELNLSYQHN